MDPSANDDFIAIIVSKLNTALFIPEDLIAKQDEESYDMYFIAKGMCTITVRDVRKFEQAIRVLKEGDHFGEISMIYKCRRSATVISQNYNTLAKLDEDQFKHLISEYPEYLRFLKGHLQKYKDPMKKFLIHTIQKLDYFQGISSEALHDIMYSLKPKYFEKGQVLIKPDDKTDTLHFVEAGILEVYTLFEGNEFVLERLYRGSALNFRSFFMEDLFYCNVRCKSNVILLDIEQKTLDFIKLTHPDFEKKLMFYQNNILKMKKTFPLDYVVHVPEEMKPNKDDPKFKVEVMQRQNIFKNVVFRRIIEVRMMKKKPKLSDIMKLMKQKDLSNPKTREDFKKKILSLYDDESQKKNDRVEDPKYDKLMSNFDRIQKVVNAQQVALDSLEKKVTVLYKRREEREINPEKIIKMMQRPTTKPQQMQQ